jgi:hypothetical protein
VRKAEELPYVPHRREPRLHQLRACCGRTSGSSSTKSVLGCAPQPAAWWGLAGLLLVIQTNKEEEKTTGETEEAGGGGGPWAIAHSSSLRVPPTTETTCASAGWGPVLTLRHAEQSSRAEQ